MLITRPDFEDFVAPRLGLGCGLLLSFLAMYPAWWIAADIPSGATSNDVVYYLGHAFWNQSPSSRYFFGDLLSPTVSWLQLGIEATMVVFLFSSALFAKRLWIPFKQINAKQWILVVSYCMFSGVLLLNPPWMANESEFANCYEKYSDYSFCFHQPIQSVEPCELTHNTVMPHVLTPLLVFEIYVAGILCMGLLALAADKSKPMV